MYVCMCMYVCVCACYVCLHVYACVCMCVYVFLHHVETEDFQTKTETEGFLFVFLSVSCVCVCVCVWELFSNVYIFLQSVTRIHAYTCGKYENRKKLSRSSSSIWVEHDAIWHGPPKCWIDGNQHHCRVVVHGRWRPLPSQDGIVLSSTHNQKYRHYDQRWKIAVTCTNETSKSSALQKTLRKPRRSPRIQDPCYDIHMAMGAHWGEVQCICACCCSPLPSLRLDACDGR